MMVLKDLLEDLSNNQIVDICCGVDENNTLRTAKTIFYGKAIDVYANRKNLEVYMRRKVISIDAYIDNFDVYHGKIVEPKIPVIMITLKEND